MLADQSLFKAANSDAIKKSGIILRRSIKSNPAPLPAKGEDGRSALLEYADFLLDQEAKYCQQ